MASQINVEVLIQAKDQATAVLQKFGKIASDTGKSITQDLSKSFIALGTAAAGVNLAIADTVKAWAENEEVTTKLSAGLENVIKRTDEAKIANYDLAGSVEGATQYLIDQALALQKVTRYTDEQILSGQTMLTTFQMDERTIAKLTPSMLDMGEAFRRAGQEGGDLQSISVLLGKAMGSEAAGVEGLSTALRRLGVMMTDAEEKTLKTGTQSERLNAIIKILDINFGGFAQAGAKSFNGQMDIMWHQFDEVKEAIGGMFAQQMKPLFDYLANTAIPALQSFTQWLNENKDAADVLTISLLTLGGTIAAAALIGAITALATALGTIGIVIAGVALAVGTAAALIKNHWDDITLAAQTMYDNLTTIWNNIVLFVQNIPVMLQMAVDTIIAQTAALNAQVGQFWYDLFFVKIPYYVGYIVGYLTVEIPKLINSIVLWFSELPGKVLAIMIVFKNYVVLKISELWAWILAEVPTWPGKIADFISSLPGKVAAIFESVKNNVRNKMSETFGVATEWWDKIKGILESIKNAAENAINKVREGFEAGRGLVGKQAGGIVPGAIGAPVPILAHGGEEVLPVGRANSGIGGGGGGITFNVSVGLYAGTETEKRNIAQDLYSALVQLASAQNKSVAELMGR